MNASAWLLLHRLVHPGCGAPCRGVARKHRRRHRKMGQHVSLAVARAGAAHITYYEFWATGCGDHTPTGTGRYDQTVDGSGNVGGSARSRSALADGRRSVTLTTLTRAALPGGPVSAGGRIVYGCAWASTARSPRSAGPAASLHDLTNGDLKYAWRQAGEWVVETVDSDGVGAERPWLTGRPPSHRATRSGWPQVQVRALHRRALERRGGGLACSAAGPHCPDAAAAAPELPGSPPRQAALCPANEQDLGHRDALPGPGCALLVFDGQDGAHVPLQELVARSSTSAAPRWGPEERSARRAREAAWGTLALDRGGTPPICYSDLVSMRRGAPVRSGAAAALEPH